MRFMHKAGVLLAVAVLAGSAGMAMAQQADIIKARQEKMKAIGADFKTINDSLKTDAPDAKAIGAAAKGIADKGKDVGMWFPKGTGEEAGVKTRAKADIWAKPAEFKAAADKFVMVSAAFAKTAAAGDMAAIKAGAKELGEGCGGCHMPFRAPAEPAAK
ncbi:MAG: c-type cytochrome [Rhodospirillaceae bacterium]